MQDALGLSRGLHVQSMMYENNYEIVLHGQCRFPDRLRAVCIPWPQITDGELDILTKSGVVGYRVTNRLEKTIDQRMIARVHEHGWSIHYLVTSEEQEDWKPQILQSPGRFVLEHMGGVDPAKGHRRRRLQIRAAMPRHRTCWVKLSPRISKQENVPVLRHRSAGAQAGGVCADPAALGLGLAASAIFQADAERRGAARPDARLGAGRSRRASGSSSTIQRRYSVFRRSNKIPPRRSASVARRQDA